MKNSQKKWVLNFVLIVLLTGFALWFALKDDADKVLSIIKDVSPLTLLAILAWSMLYNVLVGCIMTLLARQHRKDYSLMSGIINGYVGSFFSGITPSASGGQIGQVYVFKKQGIDFGDSASILWLDFIVYQCVLMSYCLLMMLLRFSYYYTHYQFLFTFIFIGFCINLAVVFMLWTMAIFPNLYLKICDSVINLLSKLKLLKNPEFQRDRWMANLRQFQQQINANKDNKKLIARLIILNILRLTLYFSLPLVIGLALSIPYEKMPIIDVIAMSSFVTMVNSFFPVPGASGGTEMMFVEIFSILISVKYASSIMIIWRFATYHFVLLLGGCLFLWVKRRKSWNDGGED